MPHARASAADKRKAFFALHASGCFVIPNPWNVGSARYLQGPGFKALATTSAGYAHSRGLPDGALPLDQVLAHCRELADATNIPLNADFENGFADYPDDVAAIDQSGSGVVFTARTEGSIRGRPDIDETIRRLKAFAEAPSPRRSSAAMRDRSASPPPRAPRQTAACARCGTAAAARRAPGTG